MTNTVSDYVDYLIFARRNSFALGPVCETVVKLVAATELPAVNQAKLLREIDGEFTKRLRADGVAEIALAPVGQTRNLLRDAADRLDAAPTYRLKFEDHGGSFLLSADYGTGYRFAASFPTGSQAAYPEAIARGRREALDKVAKFALDFYNQFHGCQFEGFPAE